MQNLGNVISQRFQDALLNSRLDAVSGTRTQKLQLASSPLQMGRTYPCAFTAKRAGKHPEACMTIDNRSGAASNWVTGPAQQFDLNLRPMDDQPSWWALFACAICPKLKM